MKKSLRFFSFSFIITLIILLLINISIFAQSPEKMSYQAIIRDASSNLITSSSVGMQISIIQGSESGLAVYTEIQISTSNYNGLVSIEIGTGESSDDFSAIDWANGPYFIKIDTDPNGGSNYNVTGISQLLSVPYALYSKTAESVQETDPHFSLSPSSSITQENIDNWTSSLEDYTETDPVFSTSAFCALTQTDIDNWNNKLGEYTEMDPLFSIHPSFGITTEMMNRWDSTYAWGDHSTTPYLTSPIVQILRYQIV